MAQFQGQETGFPHIFKRFQSGTDVIHIYEAIKRFANFHRDKKEISFNICYHELVVNSSFKSQLWSHGYIFVYDCHIEKEFNYLKSFF